MESLIKIVKNKIKKSIKINKIEIIDNTHKHKSHKSFNKGKLHLKVIIDSNFLKSMNKVSAHRLITDTLKEEMEKNIHSLEIKII